MSSKFWTTEKIFSLSAMMVSLLTLVVFIYQTNLIRQQQYMSVFPYLNLSNKYSGSLQYQYVLQNNGIGPALIDSVKITAPNGKIYNDLVNYLDDVIPSEDSIWYLHSNIRKGRLIPVDEAIPLIQLVSPEVLVNLGVKDTTGLPKNTISDAEELWHILNDDSLEIQIVYTSIYDEKWSLSNRDGVPERQ